MKKIFTLFSFLLMASGAFAQDYYVFADKDGNVYEDGVTIERADAEDDGWGGAIVYSGLYAKNVSAPSSYQVAAQAEITKLDNGALQLCFPTNCVFYSSTGKQKETAKTKFDQGKQMDLMTEWTPEAYGECTVTYTLNMYDGFASKGKRTITVNYKYTDPANIGQAETKTATPKAYYDAQGRRTDGASRGINIVRMSDGSVRKVIGK
ncbi:MAG: hypothetical protein K6C10_00815 [Prevotella sp.]|nr:hypothetical protein [Prevotella sp.]